MREESNDPTAPGRECSDWSEIAKCLEAFPSSEVDYAEGEVTRTDWVFRGISDSCFSLEPAIEREAHDKNIPWHALEKLVILEFKSRARMHLSSVVLPDPQDELT